MKRLILAAASLGLVTAAPAAADPVDPLLPVDPAVPATGAAPAPGGIIDQALAQVSQSNPLTAMADLLANSTQSPVLGLAPLPPGAIGSGPAPDPLALAELLMPQNYRMPAPDQESPYALAPNTTPSPFARIDAWKGVHALLHGGLGRMPGEDLGQALPGTAPPPGSNLPPGLEQFLPTPTDPLLIPPPADPGLSGATP